MGGVFFELLKQLPHNDFYCIFLLYLQNKSHSLDRNQYQLQYTAVFS